MTKSALMLTKSFFPWAPALCRPKTEFSTSTYDFSAAGRPSTGIDKAEKTGRQYRLLAGNRSYAPYSCSKTHPFHKLKHRNRSDAMRRMLHRMARCKPFHSVTSACTVDLEIPNSFAAARTVALFSMMYTARSQARRSMVSRMWHLPAYCLHCSLCRQIESYAFALFCQARSKLPSLKSRILLGDAYDVICCTTGPAPKLPPIPSTEPCGIWNVHNVWGHENNPDGRVAAVDGGSSL